jgi:gliding motility-associated-like protein/uncharacterized repeat protein (TIGR01451 family)
LKKSILLSLLALLFFLEAFTQVIDPFSIRYQNQQKGGITMLANVSVSCTNCNVPIAEVPPSGVSTNNDYTMSYVDVDNNPSTFMSSSDSLNLSDCSEILWAGLYWTARLSTNGTPGATTNYTTRNQIKLKVNNGAYQSLTADELLDNSTGHQTYHCFKNITSIVQNNGPKARYTVADLVTRTGISAVYGGWTMVVVYGDVYQSMRNLTVFDGLANVSTGNTVTIPITGFVTPLVGPVAFELGVVSHDGDRGQTGDQLLFNGAGNYVNVSDAAHNLNDVFNSSIAYDGVLTPFRNPSLNNTLGHDASIFVPNNTTLNYIGNNTSSANIQITTGGETILTTVVSSVIDVFEPDLRATVYISDLNGGQVNPGDQLEYTVVGKNIGSDISLGTFITDTLDPRTIYVPNSLSITYGPNLGSKTDAFLDDQAEYDPVNRVVKARIGIGANGFSGGAVTNSPTGADSTVLKFRVTVINDCLMFRCDQTIENKAYIFGTGNISGNTYNNNGLSDLYDALGCPVIASGILSVNVSSCPIPVITYNSPICVGETIQFSFPASTNANYAWSGPNGFSSSIYNPSIFSAALASQGTYSVAVTFDGLDCIIDTFATVVVNIPPIIQLNSITNVNCYNGNTGAISISAAGNGPFTYAWSNGNTTANPTGLTAGSYTVIVTNSLSCSVSQTFNVTQNAQLAGSIQNQSNFNGYNVSCFENVSDGSTLVSVSGGSPGYTYLWNNGMTTTLISGLQSGTYSVLVTDNLGCILNLSTTLTKPPLLEVQLVETDVLCFGESNGTVTTSPTGGVAPYSYTWNNGATAQNLTGLPIGTYSLSMLDANNCPATATTIISQPGTPIQISESHVDVLCFGNSTGSIDVSVLGGTSPYTYSWSIGQTTEDLTAVGFGLQTVIVTDQLGCQEALAINIQQPAQALTLVETHTDALCIGGQQGTINVQVSGGTIPYVYSWNNGSTNQDQANLLAGVYIAQVTDNNNCQASINIEILDPSNTTEISETHTDVICFAGTTGSIDLSVTGGLPPYIFDWTNGAITEDIFNLAAGNFAVNVLDLNGCGEFLSVMITQPNTAVSATITQTNVLCSGSNTGTMQVIPANGVQPYSFLWNNGETNASISNLTAGNYSVTVSDFNGCNFSISSQITQPPSPVVITETISNVSCFGGNNGGIQAAVVGGVPSYNYSWSTGAASTSISALVAGTYDLAVTDQNNCVYNESYVVSEPSAPLLFNFTTIDNVCFGGSSGSATVAISGGTAPYTSLWDNSVNGINYANLSAGIYSFQANDGNNCVLSESIEIFEPTQINIIDSIVSDVSCFAYSDGTINFSTIGGTAPFTYLWSSGQTSQDISNLTAGIYSVVVTDANNCQRSFSFEVMQPLALVASSNIDEPSCFGYADGTIFTSVTGGTAPFSYGWNNGATTANNVNISAGNYTVTITDNNNCTFPLSIVLTQPAQIQVSFIADVLIGCDPLVVNLINNSQEQFASSWTFGDGNDGDGNQIQQIFSGEGCYDVNLQITNSDGCSNDTTYSDFICVLETPEAEIGLSPNYIGIANPDVEITNLTTDADTYSWSFGDTLVYNYFQPGIVTYPTYVSDQYYVSLIAYNNNGCVDSTFRIINFDNSLVIYVPNVFTPDGDEFNNIFKPIFAAPVASYNLKIYNRWGEILFESNDTEVGWDGTYNGMLVQDGAYTWDILVTTFETRTYRKQGTVSILK